MMTLTINNFFRQRQNGLKRTLKRHRRVIKAVAFTVAVPALFIAVAGFFAEDADDRDRLEVARLVLDEYVDQNPPNGKWERGEIRVTEDMRLEMDVSVPAYEHAKFIESRTKRVQHSYLKLACPPAQSDVFDRLIDGETVWIRLMYKGEVITKGPCPKPGRTFG